MQANRQSQTQSIKNRASKRFLGGKIGSGAVSPQSQVYHQFQWCATDAHEDFCFFCCCERPEEPDEIVDVEVICNELRTMAELGDIPASIELC